MTSKEQTERVQKLENFAARVAHGETRKYDHVTPVFKELKWMKMENKITFDICVFTYKICNNLLPDWLFTFPTISELNTRTTRQSLNLFVARTKTDIGARAISVKGPKIWNTIPATIRNQPTITAFKDKLKKYLIKI